LKEVYTSLSPHLLNIIILLRCGSGNGDFLYFFGLIFFSNSNVSVAESQIWDLERRKKTFMNEKDRKD